LRIGCIRLRLSKSSEITNHAFLVEPRTPL
jgi:hypothetical protein